MVSDRFCSVFSRTTIDRISVLLILTDDSRKLITLCIVKATDRDDMPFWYEHKMLIEEHSVPGGIRIRVGGDPKVLTFPCYFVVCRRKRTKRAF